MAVEGIRTKVPDIFQKISFMSFKRIIFKNGSRLTHFQVNLKRLKYFQKITQNLNIISNEFQLTFQWFIRMGVAGWRRAPHDTCGRPQVANYSEKQNPHLTVGKQAGTHY